MMPMVPSVGSPSALPWPPVLRGPDAARQSSRPSAGLQPSPYGAHDREVCHSADPVGRTSARLLSSGRLHRGKSQTVKLLRDEAAGATATEAPPAGTGDPVTCTG